MIDYPTSPMVNNSSPSEKLSDMLAFYEDPMNPERNNDDVSSITFFISFTLINE